MNDAALRLAKAHIIAHCRWDGKEDTRPKLHRAAAVFLTVDFMPARPGVRIAPKPDFATVMRIAKGRAYPVPRRLTGPLGSLLYLVNQETPRVCVARAARWGWPSHTTYTLPHNPGTPRWHAGVRDGRAGVGGG